MSAQTRPQTSRRARQASNRSGTATVNLSLVKRITHRITHSLGVMFGDPYRVLLLLCMGVYTWVFSGLAIAQHMGMRTHKADMGQIDQAVWNSSRGRFVEMTDFGFLATRMTDHVEPILALISPIYWVWDDPRALLILQTLFVAAGAWILYHLALLQINATLARQDRDKIWHTDALLSLARPIALALSVAYLLAPPLQAAVLTEFHAVPLVVPLVLWALWAVAAQRWTQFAVAVVLVAVVKEETALLAAGLGVWALWRIAVVSRWDSTLASPRTRGPLLLAGALTLAALVWFYVATFVIVPHHAKPVYGIAESGYFARYGALGESPADIFRSFFTRPGLVWEIATEPVRLDYLRRMLMPFGYLSLLAPDVILLSLPVLLANQLSAYPAQYYGEYHYSAPVIVYFAAAAAVGAARLWRVAAYLLRSSSASFQHLPASSTPVMNLVALARNASTALRPLFAGALVVWFLVWGILSYVDAGRGPGGPRLDATPVTAHHRLLPRFTQQIPRDAAVTATAAVHPHVSHRRFVYQFPMGMGAPTPPDQQAEWALFDVTMAIDMAPGDLRARVEEMLAGEWGVVDAADGFLLLRKGATQTQIPPDFYTFARPPDELAGEAGVATAVDALLLLQTELNDRPYWRATQVISDWQAGPGIHADGIHGNGPGPRPAAYFPDGEVVDPDLNATAPALTWLPVAEWSPGEPVRITTLPHYLPATWGLVVHDDAGERLTAAYHRGARDILHELPLGPQMGAAESIGATLGLVERAPVAFRSEAGGAEIRLRAWVAEEVHLGESAQVFFEWETEGGIWPADLNVFVHLRQGEGNLAQADGRPRYFVEGAGQADGRIWDWRRLAVSHELPGLDEPEAVSTPVQPALRLVTGLYNPHTGVRLPLVDDAGVATGDEVDLGPLQLLPPRRPDQTCALIPDTCASQQ